MSTFRLEEIGFIVLSLFLYIFSVGDNLEMMQLPIYIYTIILMDWIAKGHLYNLIYLHYKPPLGCQEMIVLSKEKGETHHK